MEVENCRSTLVVDAQPLGVRVCGETIVIREGWVKSMKIEILYDFKNVLSLIPVKMTAIITQI